MSLRAGGEAALWPEVGAAVPVGTALPRGLGAGPASAPAWLCPPAWSTAVQARVVHALGRCSGMGLEAFALTPIRTWFPRCHVQCGAPGWMAARDTRGAVGSMWPAHWASLGPSGLCGEPSALAGASCRTRGDSVKRGVGRQGPLSCLWVEGSPHQEHPSPLFPVCQLRCFLWL